MIITREANHPRKAMRVGIPLTVEIEGASYAVRDWSTSGVGIEGLARQPAPGELIPARLSFPMLESTLVIPVQLVYRRLQGDVSGFEFHSLSPRNRRLLRHYIELSVDGKLGDVEDIVAVAALPETPMALDEPPPSLPAVQGALRPHRTRPWGSIAVFVAVMATALAVGWYHLTYQLEGTGFVAGSIARVTANHDGQIARLLVQPGTKVTAETPLFAVENTQLRTEVEAITQQVALLAGEQARLTGARRAAEAGLLGSLRGDWTARQRELDNARQLYESGAITQRDLLLVSDRVDGLRRDYLRQVADDATRLQSLDAADALTRARLELAAKKALLAKQEAERTVRAPMAGKVFQIERRTGEFVAARDPVVLLETDVTPSVFLRLPDEDALKLRLGMPAEVYVPYLDRKYAATVTAVGLAAASAAAVPTQEGGLDQTLVKVDFNDPRTRLPANARVNVWIRNPALPWS